MAGVGWYLCGTIQKSQAPDNNNNNNIYLTAIGFSPGGSRF